VEYGVSYPAGSSAVRQAQLAEELGFDSVGFYDSPALEQDVWITVANAVQATKRIHVGTEVLIPHLRHPVAQAAAITTIEQLSRGRLYVAIGTGFSGRMAMGQQPLTWNYMRQFLLHIKALLAGEQVEIDGALTQLQYPTGFGAPLPLDVPILVAANGPKGVAVAREFADGLIYGGDPTKIPNDFATLWMNAGAIILDEGDTPSSPHVFETAQIMFALRYHLAYEGFSSKPIGDLPYGDEWLGELERRPASVRHLAVHDKHAVGTNDLDAAFLKSHPDAFAAFLEQSIHTPETLRKFIDRLAASGVTHIGGPALAGRNWEWATRSFAKAIGL
jgi:5,10-methylenetetrahydromethanopterin reductase